MDRDAALAAIVESDDPWTTWRAMRLRGGAPGDIPDVTGQDAEGGFLASSSRTSPGATGEALCHLALLGAIGSGTAVIAADWLLDARTPAGAWLDSPDDVPGPIDDPTAGRVWASAAAVCGLVIAGRDPGERVVTLLRGEADSEGRFSGGAYPTFAGAAAYWLVEGPQTETAEWALRWTREWREDWWGPWEFVTALTFWAAAGIPADHPSMDVFLDDLLEAAPPAGWDEDPELTLRTLELLDHADG